MLNENIGDFWILNPLDTTYKDDFKPDYWVWTEHKEVFILRINSMWIMLEIILVGSMQVTKMVVK